MFLAPFEALDLGLILSRVQRVQTVQVIEIQFEHLQLSKFMSNWATKLGCCEQVAVYLILHVASTTQITKTSGVAFNETNNFQQDLSASKKLPFLKIKNPVFNFAPCQGSFLICSGCFVKAW